MAIGDVLASPQLVISISLLGFLGELSSLDLRVNVLLAGYLLEVLVTLAMATFGANSGHV